MNQAAYDSAILALIEAHNQGLMTVEELGAAIRSLPLPVKGD